MLLGSTQHVPVLAQEVLEWLRPAPGQTIVDGTLGGGGPTRLLAQAAGPRGGRGRPPTHPPAQPARIIRESVPRSREERIDPATRTFQALRIAVNEELKW